MHNCKKCKKHEKNDLLIKSIFQIDDVSSEDGLTTIETKLNNLAGVEHVDTDLSVGQVKVFYDDRMVAPEELKDAIDRTGYRVSD